MRLIGKVAFFFALPAIALAVRRTTRTRVLIRWNGTFLLMKPWLGSDQWLLPGGGLHRREDPRVGAAREVKEEVGISLNPKELKYLGKHTAQEGRWFQYDYHLYIVDVPSDAIPRLQKLEVQAAQWFTVSQIQEFKSPNETVLKSVLTFRNT